MQGICVAAGKWLPDSETFSHRHMPLLCMGSLCILHYEYLEVESERLKMVINGDFEITY